MTHPTEPTSSSNTRSGDWESFALPACLIAIGMALLLANNLGILALERIQNLWPIALVAAGLIEMLPLRKTR